MLSPAWYSLSHQIPQPNVTRRREAYQTRTHLHQVKSTRASQTRTCKIKRSAADKLIRSVTTKVTVSLVYSLAYSVNFYPITNFWTLQPSSLQNTILRYFASLCSDLRLQYPALTSPTHTHTPANKGVATTKKARYHNKQNTTTPQHHHPPQHNETSASSAPQEDFATVYNAFA